MRSFIFCTHPTDIIRQIKSRRKRGKCTGFLVRKPKGKRPLGRPSRRWQNGIRMNLREIGWGYRVDPPRVVAGIKQSSLQKGYCYEIP
jgi:hypothetical protein